MTTILMSNLGYLRGIDGRLIQHLLYAHRHFYCSVDIQKRSLQQLIALMEEEDPDLCCFVEIDKGSSTSANFNQIEMLISDKYPFFDIENKYAHDSKLRQLPRSKGKSNAFVAKHNYVFEKMSFEYGTKRLIYRIELRAGLTLFFAHFSLKRQVRAQQLLQLRRMLAETQGEHILLGDFNILTGLGELQPLLRDSEHVLLNKEDVPTFTFHRFVRLLDLCICSKTLASRIELKVIPQPYSDHAALLLKLAS